MKVQGSAGSLVAVAALALLALGASGAAQARDVFWSVGVASSGVQLGVSNAPPLVVQRPVVVLPQPVYYGPPPVVYALPRYAVQPQVVYMPAPYVVQSAWVPPGHRKAWRKRHFHHDRWDSKPYRRDWDGRESREDPSYR